MTPQELKNSILQLAIQGKLVEQRLEEGTAEELFREIQKEKQALIKAGKIKKEKPLPEIVEEELPFEIPETWKWVYIGEIFLHNTGKAQNASGSSAGTLRKFITTSNLYWNEFDFSKVKEMPFTEQEIERCSARKGDLLVCEGGDCGRSAIWNYDEEVCIQNHVHRLRPYSALSIEYFYYVFFLYKFTGRLRGRGVAIQGLSSEAIHKVICPLPPLAEQKRIVAKIEELLPLIDRYEKAWIRLEDFNKRFPGDMQKSILQMAIQGKLVEQRPEEGTGEELYREIQKEKQALIKAGKIKKEKLLPKIAEEELPFEIPKNWMWVKLSELLRSQPTNGFSPKGVDYITPYKNLTLTATTSGVFKPDAFKYVDITSEIAEKYFLFNEDILIQRSNSRELVGTPCVYRFGPREYIYPDLMMRIHLLDQIETDYIVFVLKAPAVRIYFQQSATGTSESMPKINQSAVRNVLIPLPPLAEQKRIVARLEELLPLCERLK